MREISGGVGLIWACGSGVGRSGGARGLGIGARLRFGRGLFLRGWKIGLRGTLFSTGTKKVIGTHYKDGTL